MRSVFEFIVQPKEGRNTNIIEVDNQELILNTELGNHNYVSRIGVVKSIPFGNPSNIEVGDEVIVHHNVFRRFRDIRGAEKNSKSYYKEDMFFVATDQIFAYKREDKWKPIKGFNFVQPIEYDDMFSMDNEEPLKGILVYKDDSLKSVKENDLIGFEPGCEYEFIINGQRLYRVPTNSITIKCQYQGHETKYNSRWASSSN